jgi:hypothetical protein
VLGGRIYVIGGFDGTERLRSVECFTPGPEGGRPCWHQVAGLSRHMLAQVPDMLDRRSNFSVSVLEDKLVVAGGYRQEPGGGGAVCGKVEVFCPTTGRWSRGPPLHQARFALASAVLPRGALL